MLIDLSGKTVWQIGSGDGSRNYAQVFFDYGVALVGPGDHGKHGTEETDKFYETHPEVRNWGIELARVKKGDWMVIRKGRKQILGIGEVVGPYDYSSMFEDIEGWDLQHFVRVDWYQPIEKIEFDGTPLVMSTLANCAHEEVLSKIDESAFKKVNKKHEVTYEKDLPKKLSPTDLTSLFIDKGIRIQDAENIANTINRIIQLATWYYKNDFGASEHELRTFLVVPLLISLGWPEQKIKIEYRNIDIALFQSPYRQMGKDTNPDPFVIIETKKYDNGLAFSNKQIERYAAKFPGCERFVTTNGYRYRYYNRNGDELVLKGYINLLNLRERDLIDPYIMNAFSTLLAISNLLITQKYNP